MSLLHECTCGAKYRLPDEAAGKKARCKKCGTAFVVAAAVDEAPLDIFGGEGLLDEVAAATQRAKTQPRRPQQAAEPEQTEYQDGLGPIRTPVAPVPTDEIAPTRGSYDKYLHSVLWTFLFPTLPSNLINFVIIWFLVVVASAVLSFAGCVGLLGQFAISGWYYAFLFNCVANAAAGEEELPSIDASGGWMEDIVFPFFSWIGSWLFVLLPAIVFGIYALSSGKWDPDATGNYGLFQLLRSSEEVEVTLGVLALVGGLLWPIVALCVALGGFSTVIRLDLMVITIARTVPAYIATFLLVFVPALLIPLIVEAIVKSTSGGLVTKGTAGYAVANTFEIYFQIVAMRAIGLYYHHFKDKFAWSWG